jgi:hypothetical protein
MEIETRKAPGRDQVEILGSTYQVGRAWENGAKS